MHWLLSSFEEHPAREALVFQSRTAAYADLLGRIRYWLERLDQLGVRPGDAVAVTGDHSTETTAVLIALASRRCIAVLIAWPEAEQLAECLPLTDASLQLEFRADELTAIKKADWAPAGHPLITELRARGHAGVVLFSSGSTGKAKAILLDFTRLTATMRSQRRGLRLLAFLSFGHIGGLNTVMRTLASGGSLVMLEGRQAVDVCQAIERYRVQVLPTSPTFLTMLLMSGLHEKYDLSSLELITYGTEAMPESTLRALRQALPSVKLKQTYGLSELGILPTKSEDSASLFMKIGGPGIETKIVDDVLWIRADTAMLGYLNAPSPFTEDGWYNTGDAVEARGDYLRIVGRQTEMINVGGQKVFPSEVESVLLEIPNIADAMVFGAPSPITGQVVRARVVLDSPEDPRKLQSRVKQHCRSQLEPFKVPFSVEVSETVLHGGRFKKSRGPEPSPRGED